MAKRKKRKRSVESEARAAFFADSRRYGGRGQSPKSVRLMK